MQPGVGEGFFGEIGHVSVQPHTGPGLGILLHGCTTVSKVTNPVRNFEVFEKFGLSGVSGKSRILRKHGNPRIF